MERKVVNLGNKRKSIMDEFLVIRIDKMILLPGSLWPCSFSPRVGLQVEAGISSNYSLKCQIVFEKLTDHCC